MYIYLNFMFMKQLIQHLYYDYVYAKAVLEASFFTIDLARKDGGRKKDNKLQVSPLYSILTYLFYFSVDFVITLLVQGLLGWPLVQRPEEALKLSAAATILLRESISEAKLPDLQSQDRDGENVYRIPIATVDEDGNVERIGEEGTTP